MNHPDPDRIREMCDRMEKAGKEHVVKISMLAPRITQISKNQTPCGTICCHGGLAVLALCDLPMHFGHREYNNHNGELEISKRKTLNDNTNISYGYTTGAWLMARFVWGREEDDEGKPLNGSDLQAWANEHPKIWGNRQGYGMFVRADAFGCTTRDIRVRAIIKHWRAVADRIEAAQ